MVQACVPPPTALTLEFRRPGDFVDCYVADIARDVALEDFVYAFYTCNLFRAERRVLRWLVNLPSTDAEARDIAAGRRDSFAAWRVEARRPDQLLLTDFRNRTRSWFGVAPFCVDGAGSGTRLYFGSMVLGGGTNPDGTPGMPFAYRALIGFHRVYSRALLASARRCLQAQGESN